MENQATITGTVTRVFTEYDVIPKEIQVKITIPDVETTHFSVKNSHFTHPYRLSHTEAGLEGVVFAHYEKVDLGGFIGEMEGIVHWVHKGVT